MIRKNKSVVAIFISKLKYILLEEGLGILIIRSVAFIKFNVLIRYYKSKHNISEFKQLKNSVHDKRIFLIGNGPSLNRTPLHLLDGENVFCFNRFNLMLERINFTPQYFACIDDRVLSTIREDIYEISTKVKYVFLPFIHPSSGKNFNKIYHKIKNARWLILNKFGYSLNLPYIGINKSVTNCSLQIAAYMGFTEIYLIGVDLDYEDHKSVIKENRRDWTSDKDDDPNHFDPRYFGKGKQYHHPRLDETIERWEEAKSFFKKNGVSIFNASVGGKLEVFERVLLKDVLNISEKDEMLLFLKTFNISEFISTDLSDYFPEAEKISSFENFNTFFSQIISDTDTAIKLIPKVIFDYIPYGPVLNQYLFIRREKSIET